MTETRKETTQHTRVPTNCTRGLFERLVKISEWDSSWGTRGGAVSNSTLTIPTETEKMVAIFEGLSLSLVLPWFEEWVVKKEIH